MSCRGTSRSYAVAGHTVLDAACIGAPNILTGATEDAFTFISGAAFGATGQSGGVAGAALAPGVRARWPSTARDRTGRRNIRTRPSG